ncbi:hypothetical protein [Arcticibacter sp. MXS-1]|uniref:hypothetical protein n=1 Tax=Arcticibacter sp. MXS-1 TaxID=3341726 RepID=UPI0035A8EEE0
MKEYKYGKGLVVLTYLAAPVVIALFAGALVMILRQDHSKAQNLIFFGPLSLFMAAFMIYSIMDVTKRRLLIGEGKVTSIGPRGKVELPFEEIKGFRLDRKFIWVIPATSGSKRMKISRNLKDSSEILAWFSAHYPDLDVQSAEEDRQAILNSEEYGFNEEDREARLKRAAAIARVLNIAGVGAGLWTFFWPQPYEYLLMACAGIAFLALLAIRFSNGLIHAAEQKGSAHPSVMLALLLAGGAFFLRVLIDFDIFDRHNAWIPTAGLSLLLMAFVLIGNREVRGGSKQNRGAAVFIIIFLLAYSYSLVIALNCLGDRTEPFVYETRVLNKHISSGKHRSYYLKLAPWGPQQEEDEVEVDRELYNRMELGSQAYVYFRNGSLNIPWFVVTD